MSDLGHVLGSILASIAHARRIADEETLAIAEYYRSNPLLEGMSLPRVRLPEVTVELPVLVKEHSEGEADTIETEEKFREIVVQKLNSAAKAEGVKLAPRFVETFDLMLTENLTSIYSAETAGRFPRESAVRAVEKAMATTMGKVPVKLTSGAEKEIKEQLRTIAGQSIITRSGTPGRLEVSVLTSEVKESAGSANIARMKVMMKEEGLEWSIEASADGGINGKLIPE